MTPLVFICHFGTSLENAPSSELGVAATQPQQLFKSHPRTATVMVTKAITEESRIAN
jgi:hypothetical protein